METETFIPFIPGEIVVAIGRGFAIGVGDKATVVEDHGMKMNPFLNAPEHRIKVHVHDLDSDMETEAAIWQRQQ